MTGYSYKFSLSTASTTNPGSEGRHYSNQASNNNIFIHLQDTIKRMSYNENRLSLIRQYHINFKNRYNNAILNNNVIINDNSYNSHTLEVIEKYKSNFIYLHTNMHNYTTILDNRHQTILHREF